MEIPYTVTARPDTGLWNAKLGIWLFLASEVMLFGGLFSSYVFLRLGADYPWPMHELDVPFGFWNTLILIASSVFVVYAWVMLKMRKYRAYQFWMLLVVLCAVGFLINKGFEYTAKFKHWHAEMNDHSIIAGHLEKGHPEHRKIVFDAGKVNVNYVAGGEHFLDFVENEEAVTFTTAAGTQVDVNGALFRKLRKAQGLQMRADELAAEGNAEAAAALNAEISEDYPLFRELQGDTQLALTASPPARFMLPRKRVDAWSDQELTLTAKTPAVLSGTLISDDLTITIDEIDLRKYLARDGTAEPAIEDAMIFQYVPDAQRQGLIDAFKAHRQEKMAEHLEEVAAWEKANPGQPYPERAFYDFNRVYIKDLHLDEAHGGAEEQQAATGGDAHHGPKLTIPFTDIRYFSNYGPSRNNFYAIYFTMTGLHGLHVLGGMLVLGYFLIFGGRLYRKNPEHLANRVEVGGLFWHFVDLVWIFLFPIFYLM